MFTLDNPLVFKSELLTMAGLKTAFATIKRTCMGGYTEFAEGDVRGTIQLPANMGLTFESVSEYDGKPAFAFFQKKGWPCTDNKLAWSVVTNMNKTKDRLDPAGDIGYGLYIFCRLNEHYFALDFVGGKLYEFDQKELILFSFILEAFTGVASNTIYHEMIKRREGAIQYFHDCAVKYYQGKIEQRQKDVVLYNENPSDDTKFFVKFMKWCGVDVGPDSFEKPARELLDRQKTFFKIYAIIGDYAIGYSGNAYNESKQYAVRHEGRNLKAGDTVTIGRYDNTVQLWWIID